MKPRLKIGIADFTDYVAELKIESNDLDADGSGRDIHTGQMFRTRIATKDKIDVTLLRIWEDTLQNLRTRLRQTYLNVIYLDPATNTQVTKAMYCSGISQGIQRYDKSRRKTCYDGVSFSLIER